MCNTVKENDSLIEQKRIYQEEILLPYYLQVKALIVINMDNGLNLTSKR